MRILTFKKKKRDTPLFLLERAFNTWIPAFLSFIAGYTENYFLFIIVFGIFIFEFAFSKKGLNLFY